MLNKIILGLEAKKSYHKPMSFMSGINQAIELIRSHLPEFEEDIKKAYDSGYSDGVYENGFNGDAQDYFNQNYKP